MCGQHLAVIARVDHLRPAYERQNPCINIENLTCNEATEGKVASIDTQSGMRNLEHECFAYEGVLLEPELLELSQ